MPRGRSGDEGRAALLDAAERLFAERGVEAVSLREVGAAAGARNNSAAQYHFGDRAGIVEAIFVRRMVPIDARRRALLAAEPDPDVRVLVRAVVEPLASAVSDEPGSTWYVRFLAERLRDPRFVGAIDLDASHRYGLRQVVVGLRERLDHLPPLVRDGRIELAIASGVFGLADHERRRDLGMLRPGATVEHLVPALVDALVGMLDAPDTTRSSAPAPAHRRGGTP